MSDVTDMMDNETWMTSQEAKDAGFIDTINDDGDGDEEMDDVANSWANVPAVFNKAPASLLAKLKISNRINVNPNGQVGRAAACSPPAPAALKGEPVNLDSFKAYAAEHPEAVAGFIEQGKKTGAVEARASESQRMKDIAAACGGDYEMAVNSFVAGHDAPTVKLAADAAAKVKTQADAAAKAQADAIAAKDAEIAKLKEQAAFAQGGQRAIGTGATADANKAANGAAAADADLPIDKKAELEFDNDAKIRAEYNNNKRAYVKWRVNSARGNIQKLSNPPAAQ